LVVETFDKDEKASENETLCFIIRTL